MSPTKFTWGDNVVVRDGAPDEARPGAQASVCGMREVESRREALAVGVTPGTVMYIIEFGDGTSVEVPESWLREVAD